MKKTIRLTESELVRLVKKVINEQSSGFNFTIKKYPNKKFFVEVTTPTITKPTSVYTVFPGVSNIGDPKNFLGFNSQEEANNFLEEIKKLNLVSKDQIQNKYVQLFRNEQETDKFELINAFGIDQYKGRLDISGSYQNGRNLIKITYVCGNDYFEMGDIKLYNKKYTDLLKNYLLCDISGSMSPITPDF
jgi:hypothetical protein